MSLFARLLEIHENHLRHGFEAFENARAIGGTSFEIGNFRIPMVEFAAQHFDGERIGHIALIVLNDERNFFDVVAISGEVVEEVVHRDEVCFEAFGLAICDEHDAIGAFHDEATAIGIEELPRHRIEVKSRLEPANLGQFDGQKVEIEGTLLLRFEADELAARIVVCRGIDVLDVRRFPTQSRSVIDYLEDDFSGRVIKKGHE